MLSLDNERLVSLQDHNRQYGRQMEARSFSIGLKHTNRGETQVKLTTSWFIARGLSSRRRKTIPTLLGQFLIIAKLEEHDIGVSILGMGRVVAISRHNPVLAKPTTNRHDLPVLLDPLLDQVNGITSRLCFPQEQLKLSHSATRLCPCGFRICRVVAVHEASPSRPLEPFPRARPGAFTAMQPTAPIRHGRSPARSSASASHCSAARAGNGDCKTRLP